MKDTRKKIVSDIESEKPKNSVIGIFEGECADSNITNENGLDITRPVWENIFSSESYQQAIELGWYIGFLGHPDDPGCMDFRNACIVMTEGHIDDNGKVYGKFNLIDTPVGRTVKTFIDAGVTFGISVRGAGDIVNNSVDPDTFVFRGFDLVSFPAFPESIPTFTSIAASSDVESQKKYKAICAAVKENLPNIDSCEAIDILQCQFAEQSDEYKALEDRKKEIKGCNLTDDDVSECDDVDITKDKVESMTKLYLEQVEANNHLKKENEILSSKLASNEIESRRKISSISRITADQIRSATDAKDAAEKRCKQLVAASIRMKETISQERSNNLKYLQKISESKNIVDSKDSLISSLKTRLNETVTASDNLERRTSNLDEQLKRSKAEIIACKKMLKDYQDAYAELYSQAIGADLQKVKVTASTSVSSLRSAITSSISRKPSSIKEPEEIDVDDCYFDDDIVTI
uniref:Prohead core protein serine protease n=1 Tax=Siphoviridae sp. ctgN495 TaxID=2825608 RepID=A0A8S5UCK5_9CAUD|nr:MAG TPA: Prohead core protein serine protease [Siphoviridae sp. ctgN495]